MWDDLVRYCPTCDKREVIIDDGCAVCLFFRSDEHQERLERLILTIFEQIPHALEYPINRQVRMVMRTLPYVRSFRAKYREEIDFFSRRKLKEMFEERTIEVEEEGPAPKTLRMWRIS